MSKTQKKSVFLPGAHSATWLGVMGGGQLGEEAPLAAAQLQHKGLLRPGELGVPLPLQVEGVVDVEVGGEQLGPSTRRALDALAAGTPYDEVGRRGDTNGAAMRIAPVGIAAGISDLDALVDMVEAASALTHNTGLAISGAAAVAAAVSAAIEGIDGSETVELACRAADRGVNRGAYSAGAADVTGGGYIQGVDRIETALAVKLRFLAEHGHRLTGVPRLRSAAHSAFRRELIEQAAHATLMPRKIQLILSCTMPARRQ